MAALFIVALCPITKTCPCNIQRFFSGVKIENFHKKNLNIFNILAQNIHCEYTLEPPRRGGSNEYPQHMFWIKDKKTMYPCKPQCFYNKVGYEGVNISRTCFPDAVLTVC